MCAVVKWKVGADDFDRAWGRLGAKLGDQSIVKREHVPSGQMQQAESCAREDLNLVAQKMNQLFTETLQTMDRDKELHRLDLWLRCSVCVFEDCRVEGFPAIFSYASNAGHR